MLSIIKEKVESALKIIAGITFVFIVIGNLYEFFYYDQFEINIFSYISTTEIFLLFLPIIIKVGAFLAALILLVSEFIRLRYEKVIEKVKKQNNSFTLLKRRFKFYKRLMLKTTIAILLIQALISVPFGILKTEIQYNLIHLINEILIYLFLTPVFLAMYYYTYRKDKTKRLSITIILLLPTVFIFFQFAEYTGSQLKLSKADRIKYIIQTKDMIYRTNDTLKFIGQSNNNIFIFNRSPIEDKTIIINKSDLIKPIEMIYRRLPPMPTAH